MFANFVSMHMLNKINAHKLQCELFETKFFNLHVGIIKNPFQRRFLDFNCIFKLPQGDEGFSLKCEHRVFSKLSSKNSRIKRLTLRTNKTGRVFSMFQT